MKKRHGLQKKIRGSLRVVKSINDLGKFGTQLGGNKFKGRKECRRVGGEGR